MVDRLAGQNIKASATTEYLDKNEKKNVILKILTFLKFQHWIGNSNF